MILLNLRCFVIASLKRLNPCININTFTCLGCMPFLPFGGCLETIEVNNQPIPKMSWVDHLTFWGFKLPYVFIYIVYPIMTFGALHGILLFLTLHVLLGILLSLVFQMAHAVEGMHFEDY